MLNSDSGDLAMLGITEILEDLENSGDRFSDSYAETMQTLANMLNKQSRGQMRGINVEELRGQAGNFLYFSLISNNEDIPYDIAYLHQLQSHFRNPAILVLRRIRKFLMPSHRKILAHLEEDQNRERQIHFHNLDIDRKVKLNMDEMQRYQTMAKLTRSVLRKLDILGRAIGVPHQSKLQFRLINAILRDPHHLRHDKAIRWLDRSTCSGDIGFMNRLIEKGMWVLDRKSEKIRSELENLSGLPIDQNAVLQGGNWYSLTAPVKRGEDFISIFNAEERTEQRIKHITFFVVQSAYNTDKFHRLLDALNPNGDQAVYVKELSGIYFEVDRCINESGRNDGEPLAAVTSDRKYNLLSEEEANNAREWIRKNRIKLHSLKMEVFQILLEFKQNNMQIALPTQLENQIERTRELYQNEHVPDNVTDILPKIPVKAMQAELEQFEAELDKPDGTLLQACCDFINRIADWRKYIQEENFHRRLREVCDDFDEFEDLLVQFHKVDGELEELRRRSEALVNRLYHTIYLGTVSKPTLDQAFEMVIDQTLHKIRLLEYDIIDADRYQIIFEQALSYKGTAAYTQLDQLFRELHALPRQSQLIQALGEWENHLDRQTLMDKQAFIMENEFQLQELLDQVRAEIRDRMTEYPIDSRRLRFDVFSLSDCFAGNLETSMEAMLRAIPRVSSDQEGEILLDHLQALEGQVLEAQRVTRPKGEAMRKLRDLERSKLMPTNFLERLKVDLEENFENLDRLLKRINEELTKLRSLQNRFGGDHDEAVFSLSINFYDLEQLRKIYDFVESITIMDLKRFGLVYNHKNAMMEDLFKRALNNDPSVPEDIAERVNRRIYKAFRDSKNMPLDLKILILWEVPEILESECELLIRTLNFVDHTKVKEKAAYQNLLQVLDRVNSARGSTLDQIKQIWKEHQIRINKFKPTHYLRNFELNRRLIMDEARKRIGNKFK